MTAPAPVTPAPILVLVRVGVSDALRAGYTQAGEAAVAITPEWLVSLSPDEREVLAASEADLRSSARRSPTSGGVATEPAVAPTLDEARRVLGAAVAAIRQDEARHAAEAEARAAKDAARRAAVETARQACARCVAQWTATPVPAADMHAALALIGDAAQAAGESARINAWYTPEWEAARALLQAREEAEAQAAGTALVEELLAAVEAGTRYWDGRSLVSYSVVTDANGVEHVVAHTVGDDAKPVLADEAHPLRARILAVRAAARAQVRVAIEVAEPTALAQYDAGRLPAGRIRALVGYAALSEVGAYPGGVTHREAPYIPRPRTGPVSTAAWREWLTARDEAAAFSRETPWAHVVAYPTSETDVTLVALVGGGAYVFTFDADETDETDADETDD